MSRLIFDGFVKKLIWVNAMCYVVKKIEEEDRVMRLGLLNFMIRSLKLGTDQSQHQPCCNTACGHKATQIAPEINSVDSISQTDPNLQRKGPPIGDYNEYPSTQKRRNDPYQDREPQNMKGDYGRDMQESGRNEEKKDIVEKINDSKTVSAIQKTMWASRKLKPVDMTPLHNPFLAQSQINK
ncbi:uncharacterized protein [Onthophagus taurus]|uniref:uncharacterized protein isoform X2 n=1 Tax=Onthophagus taurus TaxID=166361 RepID=UPI0039BDAF66